jgi:2-succinyl-6-hydroxy-2,4-cyclohexadiene-1-carboxylate synthase
MSLAHAPIIALHGFTGRGSDWALPREKLRGHAWLAPDLPGHGSASSVSPANLNAHLDAVARARSFFSEHPVLIGYSMGGRVALHAALAMPEAFSALVLIGSSPGLADAAERAARRASDVTLAERILKTDTATFLAEWDGQPLLAGRYVMPEPWKTRSLEARRQNTPEGLAASLAGVGTGALEPLWDRLGEIRIPTLLLAGANDVKFTDLARRMAEKIPGAIFAGVEGAGHAAHLEKPDTTAGLVADWLTTLSPPESEL